MIKIEVSYQNDSIKEISIQGHADFDQYGNDIVCAGVSSIIFGIMNAMDNLLSPNEFNITIEKNYIELNARSQKASEYLSICELQLQTIADSYRKNVKIIRR